jgi:hypothetical protein
MDKRSAEKRQEEGETRGGNRYSQSIERMPSPGGRVPTNLFPANLLKEGERTDMREKRRERQGGQEEREEDQKGGQERRRNEGQPFEKEARK